MLFYDKPALLHLAWIIKRARETKRLRVAILGDAVSAGCCDGGHGGYAAALQSYLDTFLLNVAVEIRNLASSTASPRANFFCNDLVGDEDLVVVETTKFGQDTFLEALVRDLLLDHHNSPAVVLVAWPLEGRGYRDTYNMGPIAAQYGISMVNMVLHGPLDHTGRRAQCKAFHDGHPRNSSWLYYSSGIHPNINGHALLACALGRLLELAGQQPTQGRRRIGPRYPSLQPLDALRWPHCFRAHLDSFDNAVETFRLEGFRQVELDQFDGSAWSKKIRGWEGSQAGDAIHFSIPAAATVFVGWFLRQGGMGLADVSVDGQNVTRLDGWFPGYPWLKKDQGWVTDELLPVASLLDGGGEEGHVITFRVANASSSADGGRAFRVLALGSSGGTRRQEGRFSVENSLVEAHREGKIDQGDG
jgi:hypothetical protein